MHGSTFTDIKKYLSTNADKVVLIDFFDTIVSRTIHPEYIKYLHSKRLIHIFGLKHFTTEDFYNIRRTYEDNLVRDLEHKGFKTEFCYDDLSKEIYKLIKKYKSEIHFSEEEFLSYSSKIEIELEKQFQVLNKDTIEFLIWCQNQKIEVNIVSDFYMCSEYFEKMLNNLGIRKYFKNVFISCEEKASKRNKDLYAVALRELGISNKDCIMIGDSIISDYINPDELGIKSFYLDKRAKHLFYQDDIVTKQHKAKHIFFSRRDLEKIINNEKTPFNEVVLSFFAFTERLYLQLNSKKAKSIFFLSREGQYLKKLFDIYQDKMSFGENFIKSHYLYVSRRSTLMPSLESLENETFDTIFRQYKDISVVDFIKTIGFSPDEIEIVSNDLKSEINPDQRVHEFSQTKNFMLLQKNENFKNIYESKRKEQRKVFTDYLESFGENVNEKMFVVDAGWKGTIQDHIFRALEKSSTIWGFYIGLLRPVWMDAGNFKKGIVFREYPSNSKYLSPYKENHTIFEVLLSADHGSVRGYERKNGKVKPILEYNEEEMALFNKYISNLQNKYLKLFEELCEYFNANHLITRDFEKYFAQKHAELMFKPSVSEMKLYNKFFNFDNFGIFEKFEYKRYGGIRTKLKTIYKLLRSPKLFLKEQIWPVNGLYNLKIPFLWRIYGYMRMWMM